MKRFVLYGDSWTEGQGIGTGELEHTQYEPLDVYRKTNHPISKLLTEKYGASVINKGIQANTNTYILKQMYDDVVNGYFTENDIVIIGFTSLIRDHHPFIPTQYNEKTKYGWNIHNMINEIDELHPFQDTDTIYERHFKEYAINYITEIFDKSYYDYVGFNMVYFLQHFLKANQIEYFFWNPFETIIETNYKNEHLIDKSRYINFGDNFMNLLYKEEKLILNSNSNFTVWEKNQINPKHALHPNYWGYEIIAKKIIQHISYIY
jgi:hypothetical protein